MPRETAFSALTLLVAACEQAVIELEDVEPEPSRLLELVRKTRDEAVEVGRRLAPSSAE